MRVIDIAKEKRKYSREYCFHFPYGYVKCSSYDCLCCEFGDRIRRQNAVDTCNTPLFSHSDVLRQTEKGGGDMLWHYPVVLKEDTMKRLNLESNIYYQIAIVDGGPGVFLKNTCGAIDCHLFANQNFKFTISRNDVYGVPNDYVVRIYDELFFLGLDKALKRAIELKKGRCCL